MLRDDLNAGIYVLMFLNIFYTFCKMTILMMLLILGFSFAFFMALSDPSEEFAVSARICYVKKFTKYM